MPLSNTATSTSIPATTGVPTAGAVAANQGRESGPAGPSGQTPSFVDRRKKQQNVGANERRQFGSSHHGLSEAGRELAVAIDQYKLQNHRRYITCDEMLHVLRQLGYQKG
jgi:hypothetical protein